jgi:protein-disulfide isomerase
MRAYWGGLLAAWIALSGNASVVGAGEKAQEFTRADLVAAVERAPGPSKGRAEAPVVIVDFSDFQCSYCKKFQRETLPKLYEQYIKSGKVRYVFRHLAIFGEPSVQAAQASLCALDQDRFWEYHTTLFTAAGPTALSASRLKRYAADLKLDAKGFDACLDGQKYAKVVETETLIGRALGASGTPTFLLNGQLAIGAHPIESFQKAIDALLASAKSSAAPAK